MTELDQTKLSEELLARLKQRGQVRTLGRGELLILEGERSDSLFILLAGELSVFTSGENDRELVYNILRPGEFFGELFLDGGTRSASVRAISTAMCVVVGQAEFRAFIKDYPEFAECLVLKLISRVRHATEQLRDLALKDVYQRVTGLLTEMAVESEGVRVIDHAITQQEIANRIGATREMVNHVIRGLVRGGFLVREPDRRMVLVKELPRNW